MAAQDTALRTGAKIRTNNISRFFNNLSILFGANLYSFNNSLISFRAYKQAHTSTEGKVEVEKNFRAKS